MEKKPFRKVGIFIVDKVSVFSKRLIYYSITILMFLLIISSTDLENFVIDISAEELILEKLGAKPYSAEIIVSEEFKTYSLVGEDLDALMLYLGDLKLRKTLHLNKTSSSAGVTRE